MFYFFRKSALFGALLLFTSQHVHSVSDTPKNYTREANPFDRAVATLESSNALEKQSSQAIVDANKVRKDISRLRAQIRKAQDADTKSKLNTQANDLANRLKKFQAQGSHLRQESKVELKNALNLFEQALVDKWGNVIHSRHPMSMDDNTMLFIAHNTQFRSVHPNMLNKMGTPTENIDADAVDEKMSILVPALAGQNAPPNLDISSFQLSKDQRYFAHIEVKPEEQENGNTVPLNEIHKWVLMLSDLSGKPVKNANIEIVGHMPGHVHGLPTQPRVTKEIGPGLYQVEGVKFQMKGWWVMQFNINNDNTDDSVVFNLVL